MPLEHIHKLFNGLEKVRVEAFAAFSCASIEFMDMLQKANAQPAARAKSIITQSWRGFKDGKR
jgi:hypothetical protein